MPFWYLTKRLDFLSIWNTRVKYYLEGGSRYFLHAVYSMYNISYVLLLSAKLDSSPIGHLQQQARLKKTLQLMDPPSMYSKELPPCETNAKFANVMPLGQPYGVA